MRLPPPAAPSAAGAHPPGHSTADSAVCTLLLLFSARENAHQLHATLNSPAAVQEATLTLSERDPDRERLALRQGPRVSQEQTLKPSGSNWWVLSERVMGQQGNERLSARHVFPSNPGWFQRGASLWTVWISAEPHFFGSGGLKSL